MNNIFLINIIIIYNDGIAGDGYVPGVLPSHSLSPGTISPPAGENDHHGCEVYDDDDHMKR